MHNSTHQTCSRQVRDGSISVADAALPAAARLRLRTSAMRKRRPSTADLRQGAAEVIYGAGKTPEQIAGIVRFPAAQRAEDRCSSRA